MPQAVVAAFFAIGKFVVGMQTAVFLGSTTVAIIGAAVVAGSIVAAKKLFAIELPKVDTDSSRQQTVRSTIEAQKVIYGEALVSGPISYIGLKGTDNEDLYQVITLAGHEVEAITDIHFDNQVISNSAINSGNANGGAVGSGIFAGYATINKHLGLATETADPLLVAAFTDYTSAHRGDGLAYLAMKWTFNEDSAETWNKYAPQNVKALVQGKAVYDPRLDTVAGQNPTNASYIEYQTNPVNCLIDYLMDTNYGMGILADKIDWAAAVTAADGCDVSVSVPGGTQKRFTCNGVIFATDSHKKNIAKILSSMNGTLVYSNGKYVIKAGIYYAPTETLNEDDLTGAISVKTSFERSDRFNTIKGLFIDPAQNHKSSEFPLVQLADAVTRDNGEVLEKEIALNMTNTSFMAQRISNKLVQLTDQQKIVNFPANLSAMRITVGDRVQVSVDELSWTNKVFECVGWTFSDEGGVNLTLREDSSTSYADPAVGAYSTISATGDITDGFRGVPSPSGLSVTAGLKNNELNWVNPGNPSDYQTIFVYASPNGNFSSAVKIGETDGTQFIHDASNAADSVSPADVRYYWVRAVKFKGTSAEAQSNLEPNADPNTTVFATVGRVNWADVSGSTNAPEDNATVGATVGTDFYDTDGTTVLGQTDVKNSILAQEILQVEVEAGDVLDLETGQDVDIQNLGDVAIYVSNQDAVLQTNINTVSTSLSNLEDVVVDLTSGTSDIYIQDTAPVAGVGGIPDPIPEFSRWYDSDDDNRPYYWNGTAWIDLSNPKIAQNETDITNLTTSLSTTNTNVSTNASAISVLDATSISQGNSITSISADVTALETTVNDASTGVSANATGLSNLTTRVTTAEGSITTNASDITTLQTDVTAAEGDITTNASAISGLDTRVTTAEGSITTNASDITALETTVNDGTTGVAANASGLSALDTRVTTAEGEIDTNAAAVTTLDATYTEDLAFRTKAEDENDDPIDLETSGTLDLNVLTDFVSGSSGAIQALTVRTTLSEDDIVTQAGQITALESTVNDPTNGVSATATALDSLTTEVSVIDGVVTSTSQSLSALSTTVGENTASISTQATSIDGVEAQYTVKIDNNDRVTGFGLASTTAGAAPFSEFVVIADQFSIVDPTSTALAPIQPFTVTSQLISLNADVRVDGNLLTTGTTISDVALEVGSGSSFFKVSSTGVQLGSETFLDAPFRVTAAGDLTATSANITGAITATSLSLDAGITIAKSVVGLTNVDDVSQATIQSDTLTAATSSDVGLGDVENLDAQNQAQTGLIAGTTITGGGITMSSGGAIKTTGKDSESNTTNGFFLGYNGSNYTFGVGNATESMVWNGTDLVITGEVNATSGAFTGDVSTDSKFVAGTGATSATMDGADANYKFYAGAVAAGDSPFKVDVDGTVTADRIVITRPDDPSAVIFDSAQDGLVGIGLSSISSGTDNAVAEIGFELTSNTDSVRLISSSNSNTTLKVLFPLGYSPFSITSEEDFPDSITLTFQVATVTGGVVGTFSDIAQGSKTFSRRVYSAGAASDDDFYSVYDSGTGWYKKGKDAIDGQFNLFFSKTIVTNNVDKAYRVQISFVAGSGSGSGNPNTSGSRTIYFTSDSQYFTIDSNDIIRDQAAGSTVTGDVILSGSSGTRSIVWRDSDDQDENWAIEAHVDPSESSSNTMFFRYNNATSSPFAFVGDSGSILALGDFYSGTGSVTTATASFGGGYGNTGISIDSSGNYQGNGNIDIDGTLTQGSDLRLKSDIKTIDGSKVFDMRGVSFTKSGKKGAGVIAQELQEVAPELVKENEDGMLSVAYGDIVGYLIEAVKDLKAEIEQLKKLP